MEIIQEVLDEETYAKVLKLKSRRWAEKFQLVEESEDDECELSEEPVQKKRRGKAATKQAKPAPKAQAPPAKRSSKRIAKANN